MAKKISICIVPVLLFLSARPNDINSKRTIICGLATDNAKMAFLEITDCSKSAYFTRAALDSAIVKNGWFSFELDIDHPVYFNVNYVLRAVPAFGKLNTRNVATGFLLEPGDSILIDTRFNTYGGNSGLYIHNIPLYGRGVEKNWCIQAIIRNSMIYPNPNLAVGNLARIGLVDSFANMIVKTIELYQFKMSKTAATLIKMEYLPMLNVDISDIVAGLDDRKGLNIHDPEVIKLFKRRLAESEKIINPSDSVMIYGNMFFGRITLRRRALLLYAMEKKVDFPNLKKDMYRKEYYQALAKFIPEGSLKRKTLAFFIIDRLADKSGVNVELVESSRTYLSTEDSSTVFYRQVKDQYDRWENHLQKGAPAFQFALKDTTGKTVMLDDFRGKVLILDFIFNNCPGCRRLMPIMEKVHNYYKDKNEVVFISVSVDNTFASWKQAIGKSSIAASIQLNTGSKGPDHEFPLYYNITEYPTLVLIDKKGNLVSSRAPDPRRDQGQALISLVNETLKSQ